MQDTVINTPAKIKISTYKGTPNQKWSITDKGS